MLELLLLTVVFMLYAGLITVDCVVFMLYAVVITVHCVVFMLYAGFITVDCVVFMLYAGVITGVITVDCVVFMLYAGVISVDCLVFMLYATPEGWPGMSDVSPLSGISGLSFDSTLVSPVLFFCLVLLPFLSYPFLPAGPFF